MAQLPLNLSQGVGGGRTGEQMSQVIAQNLVEASFGPYFLEIASNGI